MRTMTYQQAYKYHLRQKQIAERKKFTNAIGEFFGLIAFFVGAMGFLTLCYIVVG